jgi:hypothetical protein
MTRDQVLNLLVSIFGSREQEIVCSEFFEHLPGYVERVLGRSDTPPVQAEEPDLGLPDVVRHLGQCPECREAYELLLELARSDA